MQSDASDSSNDSDDLSPSVKRLIRQYDIDITGIHGSGPEGRLKTSDVMALVGGQTVPGEDMSDDAISDETSPVIDGSERPSSEADKVGFGSESSADAQTPITHAEQNVADTMSILFECDVTRVLADQKRRRSQGGEISLTSCVARTLARSVRSYLAARSPDAGEQSLLLDITIDKPDGTELRRQILTSDSTALEDFDAELARGADEAFLPGQRPVAPIAIRHHGLGGSLLAAPLPLAAGQTGCLGVGHVRRVVVVKRINGDDTPRVAAQCYLSLSFDQSVLSVAQANRIMRATVAALEQWDRPPVESA